MVKIGNHVIFVDAYGKDHSALVTCVFSADERCMDEEYAKSIGMAKALTKEEIYRTTSINVVLVVSDKTKQDSYGQQIERFTSIVHESQQQAHGMFWKEAA